MLPLRLSSSGAVEALGVVILQHSVCMFPQGVTGKRGFPFNYGSI